MKDLGRHPLKLYYDLGLRVTINTDNRLVTDTTVSRELWLCHTKMRMPLEDIKSLIMGGFKSAFLTFHVKQALLRQASEELQRFHADGTIDPALSASGRTAQVRSSKQPASTPAAAVATEA